MTDTQSSAGGAASTVERDMIDVLIADHREVDALFTELERGGQSPEQRKRLVSVVIAELVRHSVAEEQYLYPTTREVLPDGDAEADHEIREHAEAEQMMKELEGLEVDDPRFDQTLASLISSIRHHISDEEGDLFPRLRQACSPAKLRELGRLIEAVKQLAPTRPHPSAPDTPPWNKILDPSAGLVDRIRDALSGRPTTPEEL